MSGLPLGFLAQALRSSQGGAMPQTQGPRLPTMRAEDPDYLSALLQPIEAEESSLAAQLRQAQAMGQPSGQRYSNPFATGLGAIADALRAGASKSQQGVLNAQLRGTNQRREELINRFGQGPSASAVQRNESMLGREFQAGQADADRAFRSGEAAKARDFEASQLRKRLGAAAEERAAQAERAKTDAARKAEDGLRRELMGNPVTKSFNEAEIGFEKVQTASKDGSPASDIALVFGLMKVLDPTSTVREGEQAQASQATNVPGQILNLYNRVVTGERLTPQQRADFTRVAAGQFGAHRKAYEQLASQYEALAPQYGADPRRVVLRPVGSATQSPGGGQNGVDIDLAAPAPAAPAPPPRNITRKVQNGADTFVQTAEGRILKQQVDGSYVDVTPE